jgi:hypothetical protein
MLLQVVVLALIYAHCLTNTLVGFDQQSFRKRCFADEGTCVHEQSFRPTTLSGYIS